MWLGIRRYVELYTVDGSSDEGIQTRFERKPGLCAIDAVSREKAALGKTALQLAASKGFAPLVAKLIDVGAEPAVNYGSRDALGRVALHDLARAPFSWKAPWVLSPPEVRASHDTCNHDIIVRRRQILWHQMQISVCAYTAGDT